MKRYILNSIIVAILTLFNLGCNDFLNQEPEIAVTNSNFWQTEQDCEAALNGLEVQYRNCFKDLNIIDRDRGMPFDYLDAFWEASNNNTPDWRPTDSQLQWNTEYRTIANANLIADNLFRAKISKERYNFYLGQALAIRANIYFYIIRTWGAAPLILQSQTVGELSRTEARIIANQIIKDLKTAISILPSVSDLQDSKGNTLTSKQYFGKESAQALLAHVYAWIAGYYNETEFYKEGILYADSVINSNQFQLLKDPEEVCTLGMRGNSVEGIVETDFERNNDEINEAGICYQSFFQGWPIEKVLTESSPRDWMRYNFTSVDKLFFYKQDKRRYAYFYKLKETSQWSYSITQGAAYINKYRGAIYYVGGSMDGELKGYDDNIIHIRLADIILLRAEMKAKIGDYTGAVSDLNKIRQRAGIPDYNSAIDGELQTSIAVERERELFLEGISIRYYDNMRNHTCTKNLRGEFLNLTEADITAGALFIPVSEYASSYNPQMRQTIYWKVRGY